MALRDASDELKNNKKVVLEAVKQKGWALEHASDELKNCKEVVLEAVKQYGYTSGFASFKYDEIFLEALERCAGYDEFAEAMK